MKPTDRGNMIEDILAETVYKDCFRAGQLNRGYFPLIDFQKGNTVVSVKSVNVFSPNDWKNRIKKHIRDLREGEITVDGQRAIVQLDLRVPPGGKMEAQFLVEYGKLHNIIVKVNEFR